MDVVKICEVVDGCEDCPKYGDDCDGDKMTEHTDLISRADAIEAVQEYYQKRFTEDSKWDADAKMLVLEDKTIAKDNIEICNIIKALPSAEAEPKRVLQGYNKGANTIQTIRHEELTQIANTRKAVESADAVQGEWLHNAFYSGNEYKCSVCGETFKFLMGANFCPNCGAKMCKGGDDK